GRGEKQRLNNVPERLTSVSRHVPFLCHPKQRLFFAERESPADHLLEAAQIAAVSRFRPILMTSLATMLGALPIALALGGSARSRVSMGIVVIGGLFFSLVLTLFVIPAMYTFFSKESKETAE
ncbi:MAG: efflux RND transporter permease subunit, partial [Ignavibacteriales bacterium]|nr:efflux RND transporter permease subunit [Ignavibacteriales bacterium]